MKTKWLRTDERKEAAKGLEFLIHALNLSKQDIYYWKWVIIGLHNTVQSFIVCSISGTAGIGALKKEVAIKILKEMESDTRTYIEPKLDYFPGLYDKMKKQLSFSPGKTIDKSIVRLNIFRNDFIHFTPKGWSLELAGLPDISRDCLKVIEFLGWNPGHMHWHQEKMRKDSIRLHRKVLSLLKQTSFDD